LRLLLLLLLRHTAVLQPQAGNHDNEIDPTDGRSFVSFEARYHMPEVQPAQFNTAQNLELYKKAVGKLAHVITSLH
jgi:hypothetical protein